MTVKDRFRANSNKFVVSKSPTAGHWKRFYELEVEDAVKWSFLGNRALYTSGDFQQGRLYDADLDRLTRTARFLRSRPLRVVNTGKEDQHVVLSRAPLAKALELCRYHERIR